MFGLAAGFYQSYWAPTKLNLLVVGCQGAGKTTLLERVKVTQFSNYHRPPSTSLCDPDSWSLTPPLPSSEASPSSRGSSRRSRRHLCPAPASYRNAATLENDDDEEEYSSLTNHGTSEPQTTAAPPQRETSPPVSQQQQQDYDLKSGSKMFPLHMIRPTVGMNLGKLDACGCKCSFWDLGGKEQMRPLWERYYNDADAILFVLDSASFEDFCAKNNGSHEEEYNDIGDHHWVDARRTLWEVLEANPFRPCCIFINHYQDATCHHIRQRVMPNLLQDLLVRPPNNNNNDTMDTTFVRVFSGSAATGQGVKASLEWLIPLAKQEQIVNRPPQSPFKAIP